MAKTSNPQKRRKSIQGVFRPGFVPNLSAGGTGVDLVSGTVPVTSINGIRYGIVNGVVTQFAVNQAPIEDKGLRGCPAFTQLAKYTDDLTNAAWGKNNVQLGNSFTYQGSGITKIIETTATAIHSLTQPTALTGAADNSVVGMSFVVKADERTSFQIVLIKKDSTSAVCSINLITGVVSGNTGGMIATADILSDGYYRIFVFCAVGAGGATPNLYWRLLNSSSQFSYTGDGVSGIYFGQPTYINFGVNGIPFIPPYIPNNTGSSVSVVSEAGNTSFDLDLPALSRLKTGLRGPNAQGHFEIEVESNYDTSWGLLNLNILSARDNMFSLLYWSGTQVRALDLSGNFAATANGALIPGQTFIISIDYGTYTDGTQKMRLTVNGVKSSVVAFSGSFGAQDIRFFFGNTVNFGRIKDIKYYDRPRW